MGSGAIGSRDSSSTSNCPFAAERPIRGVSQARKVCRSIQDDSASADETGPSLRVGMDEGGILRRIQRREIDARRQMPVDSVGSEPRQVAHCHRLLGRFRARSGEATGAAAGITAGRRAISFPIACWHMIVWAHPVDRFQRLPLGREHEYPSCAQPGESHGIGRPSTPRFAMQISAAAHGRKVRNRQARAAR